MVQAIIYRRKNALAGTDTAASSPIFLLVGEGNNIATENSAIPSVEKFVKEDSTGQWGKEANDTTMKYVNFRLVGTLPADLASHETYFYAFSDTVDPKLQTAPHALTVKIDDVELVNDDGTLPYSVEIDPETGGFSVIINDILACGIEVSPSSQIVVEYKSVLEQSAPEGAVNEVCVEYSNNSVNTESHGTTMRDDVKVYSYSLTIGKKDDMGAPLPGVGFVVKNKDGVYVSRGEYGKDENAGEYYTYESTDLYVWYIDENGRLAIEGVDFDNYIIEEVEPLEGYIPLDGAFTVKIVTVDRVAIEYALVDAPARVSMTEDAVEVVNLKQVQLPITGMAGYAGLVLLGLSLISLVLFRLRYKDDKGD